MTQFSTVALKKIRAPRRATPGVFASVAVALVVGMGLGFLVSNIDVEPPGQATTQASLLTHEQFLRVNTEDMDHLAPIGLSAVNAVASSDPFLVWNVDSYSWLEDALSNRHTVAPHFWDINTSALQRIGLSSSASAAPGGDIIKDSEPFGYPNYGRLETYIGGRPESGVR